MQQTTTQTTIPNNRTKHTHAKTNKTTKNELNQQNTTTNERRNRHNPSPHKKNKQQTRKLTDTTTTTNTDTHIHIHTTKKTHKQNNFYRRQACATSCYDFQCTASMCSASGIVFDVAFLRTKKQTQTKKSKELTNEQKQ